MTLIQVKVIGGVFTAPQKREMVERLTDAMVEIEGENVRQQIWCRSPTASGAWAARPLPPTMSKRSRAARRQTFHELSTDSDLLARCGPG